MYERKIDRKGEREEGKGSTHIRTCVSPVIVKDGARAPIKRARIVCFPGNNNNLHASSLFDALEVSLSYEKLRLVILIRKVCYPTQRMIHREKSVEFVSIILVMRTVFTASSCNS